MKLNLRAPQTPREELLLSLRRLMANHAGHRISDEVDSLSPAEADCALKRGTLHEVYAQDASCAATAIGFAAGLAALLSDTRPLFWITTDYVALESGALNGRGLLEFGIDPERIVLLRLAKGEDALRAAADILACPRVGAAVLEITGHLRALDLTASRRLLLAAEANNVSAIVVRLTAEPEASAAETRWLVHAAKSHSTDDGDWGRPTFNARLLRNRHGALGQWQMEWNCEYGFFAGKWPHFLPTHLVDVASAPAGRSLAPQERLAS